jgi:hypothetical protein
LLSLGLLAVLVAMIAGVATITSVFAHHNTYTASRQCDDSWSASASYVGGTLERMIVLSDVTINGDAFATSGWNTQSPLSFTTTVPSGVTFASGEAPSGSSLYYWKGTHNGTRTIFSRSGGAGTFVSGPSNWGGSIMLYVKDGSSWTKASNKGGDTDTVTQPSAPTDCDRTIRIVKVTEGSGAPSTWSFSGTISNAPSVSNAWTITNATSDSRVDITVAKSQSHTVVETPVPAGWTLDGYRILAGKKKASDCGTKDNDYSSTAVVPSGTGDVTVCVLNDWEGNDQIRLSSSACIIDNNVQYAQFHFLLPASTGVGQGAGGTLSGTYNDGAAQNFGPINEDTTPSNGHPDWTFTLPFGSGSTVKVLTASTSTGWVWGTQGRDKDTVSKTACQPVVIQPGIEKVAADPAYSGGYAHWLIRVNNAANNQPVDVKIQDSNVINDGAVSGGSCTDGDISDGEMICTANAGATLVVPVKKAVSQQCQAGEASNSATIWWKAPGANEYTSLGTAGPVAITIPANSDLCDKPGITKTANTTSTSDPAAVKWTVTVTNPAVGSQGPGVTQAVWIKDSNVEVVSGPTFGGSATCLPYNATADFQTQLNDSDGVLCSMPNNTTITFTVKPAGTITRTCEDQKFNNTAYLYIGSTTNNPLTAQGEEITLQGNEDLCPKPKVTFVKLMCGPGATIPSPFTSPNPVTYDPNNLPADCFPMAGWNFYTGTTWNNTALGGVQDTHTTGSDGTVTHEMTLAEFNAAKTSASGNGVYNSYLVREETRSPYTFGALQCYMDYGGVTDNIEQVNFKDNPVADATCIAYNFAPRVTVNFIKAICPTLGDVPSNQGANADRGGLLGAAAPAANVKVDLTNIPSACNTVAGWTFNTGTTWDGSTLGGSTASHVTVADGISPGIAGVKHTLTGGEFMAALQDYQTTGKSYFVQEVEQSPDYLFGAIKCYADHYLDDKIERVDFEDWGLPTGDVYCIAYNVKAEREITITKHFVELPGGFEVTKDDYPAFVFAPEPAGFNFDADCTASGSNPVTWTCTVPYDWDGTVTEKSAAGWEQVDCQEPESFITRLTGMVESLTQFQTNDKLRDSWEFCNRPVGTVVVVKYENVPPATTQTWTFNGTLPGAPVALSTTGTTNVTDGASTAVANVPAGSYTLAELQGRGQCQSATTSFDYQTRGLVRVGGSLPTASDVNAAPIIGANALNVTVQKGTTTYVVFGNQGCGSVLSGANLQVIKYSDPAGNFTGTTKLAGWDMTITGTAGAATGFNATETTDADAAFFLGIPDGTYTVCETPKANWAVIGSKYNLVNQAGVCRTGVVVNLDQTVVVNFYNQPRVNIEVNKTEISLATPSGAPGSGWSFTLTGCGVGPLLATTGANGKATFGDLPPAVGCSYTVTETQQAGWSAINPVQVTAPTAAGQTSVLNFTNVKIEVCTTCITIVTPTPTPEKPAPTPTATPEKPTDPTATPTEKPAEKPTQDVVSGEKTPGPGQTPIAPSTGSGLMGSGPGGVNMLFALVGLLAISLGTTFLALGRKASRR